MNSTLLDHFLAYNRAMTDLLPTVCSAISPLLVLPTTTYIPPQLSLANVTPNPAITECSYIVLGEKLPQMLRHAMEISNRSWELGILSKTLLEVYSPNLTPFKWNATLTNESTPWAMLNLTLAALAGYNWTGAPESCVGDLRDYLDPDRAPTPLIPQALIDGDGSLGDPNSLLSAVWVLALFADREDVQGLLKVRPARDYAWAVGNQLRHLDEGIRSSNGEL